MKNLSKEADLLGDIFNDLNHYNVKPHEECAGPNKSSYITLLNEIDEIEYSFKLEECRNIYYIKKIQYKPEEIFLGNIDDYEIIKDNLKKNL